MMVAQTYDVPLVSTRYSSHFFKFLKSKGITEEVILAHNPLAKELIDNPDGYTSLNQMIPILETAQWLLNDEKAAFEFGQQLGLDTHGLFGYMLLSHEDVPQLIETVVKHMRICIPLFDMKVIHSGRDVLIRLQDTWEIGTARSFLIKMYMGSIYTVSAEICSDMHFDFSFKSSDQDADWAALAPKTQWNFDTEYNQVTLSKIRKVDSDKKLKVSYSLAESRGRNNQPEDSASNDDSNNAATQVRKHISKTPRLASIERSATLLNMSSRYLRQQLAEEGTSFREISSEVRLSYANLYLLETPMPLSKIANKLGFGDQASFTRAYRSWTGKTPGKIRKEAKNTECT